MCWCHRICSSHWCQRTSFRWPVTVLGHKPALIAGSSGPNTLFPQKTSCLWGCVTLTLNVHIEILFLARLQKCAKWMTPRVSFFFFAESPFERSETCDCLALEMWASTCQTHHKVNRESKSSTLNYLTWALKTLLVLWSYLWKKSLKS